MSTPRASDSEKKRLKVVLAVIGLALLIYGLKHLRLVR